MLKGSFKYIDSSQQQENSEPNSYYLKPSPRANAEKQQTKKNNPLEKSPLKKYSFKGSKTKSKNTLSRKDSFRQNPLNGLNIAQQRVLNDDFQSNLKDILGRKIDKQFVNLLLVEANEKQIEENLKKRNQKYKQFIRDMEIDKKYQQILEQQAFKCHVENERKKDVLRQHREIEKMKTQQQLLTKYTLQKDQYETQIVQKLKKKVRKIGVERVQSAHQNVKKQLLQKRANNKNKLQSKANEQYNKLIELKEQLQRIKKEKHVNKIEQQKVLREFQKQVVQKKKDLQVKLKKGREFII